MNKEPEISVGILKANEIEVDFGSGYVCCQTGEVVASVQKIGLADGRICFADRQFDELAFAPREAQEFTLHNVCIGIGFHWQRYENQRFYGSLAIVVDGDGLWAVNKLPVEDYLFSVIASEMSATSSAELLKAHAVVSRSWLMAQLDKNRRANRNKYVSARITPETIMRWYDREDHTLFDVCADDHCQRYQGLTRATSLAVRQAIDATRGELLMSGDAVCDARFSKCCGGATELFSTCWEPLNHSYLQSFADAPDNAPLPDLRNEETARQWICSSPKAFCNTIEKNILRQVLNNYDQETADFYRWRVEYSAAQLTDIVNRKSGLDFGLVTDIVPIERGASGRLISLRIVGTKRSVVIGKELEIRRILSESHLYSSAFVVDKSADGQTFVIRGAGWGHGVGMCQIGAAVMSESGYGYRQILSHYFRGAEVRREW